MNGLQSPWSRLHPFLHEHHSQSQTQKRRTIAPSAYDLGRQDDGVKPVQNSSVSRSAAVDLAYHRRRSAACPGLGSPWRD